MEVWKEIDGYGNYNVSNFGNVKNIVTNKILKSTCNPGGYSMIGIRKDKKRTVTTIHRLVMNAFTENYNSKKCIDHKDGNRSNNNLKNLRWATHSENNSNKSVRPNTKCGAKGIIFEKRRNKYVARITINGKTIYLGQYDTIEEAMKVRMKKAQEVFGEFCHSSENNF